ncbi:MAG: RNA pseudouridine synthase [Flavobacteriales bacterium]|nr:RNA pseudouridine synthase [Flavobacteriales bacterium]
MKIKRFEDILIQEDENLLIINKPPMVSSLQERIGIAMSVQELAQNYYADAQLCHRLDKETSGILLIAKNAETYREIAVKFEKRQMDKTYWAIADGRHYFEKFEVDLPLSVSSKGRAKIDKLNGKPAQTLFQVLEQFKHFSLIESKPITGRLHQIRIHLASQNAPIAGDVAYGGQLPFLRTFKKNFNLKKLTEEQPLITRAALHAHSLQFELFGKQYSVDAALPKDMAAFLNLLRKYDNI